MRSDSLYPEKDLLKFEILIINEGLLSHLFTVSGAEIAIFLSMKHDRGLHPILTTQ